MTDATTHRSRRRRLSSSPWFHLLLAFVVFGLVLTFIAKPYRVPSGSMEEILQPGDSILVNRLAYVNAAPGDGDIVVFNADQTWGTHSAGNGNPLRDVLHWFGEVTGFGASGPHTLVKRIIGTAGQTVSCCSIEGHVVVDGHPIDEPYVFEDYSFTPGTLDCTSTPASSRCFPEVTVPPDSYLVLGDHRSGSADSAIRCRGGTTAAPACFRWAHRSDIVGKAVAVLWPVNRWHTL